MDQCRQLSGHAPSGERWSRSFSPKQSLGLTLAEKAWLGPLCAQLWNAALPVRKTMVFMGRLALARKKELNSKEKDASIAGKGNGRHITLEWAGCP